MKKITLIFLAAIIALFIVEVFISKIVGYPVPGVWKSVLGIKGDGEASYIYYPYSKYWTVEGGNKVFRRNNIGLPGINIEISPNSKYVYVLGSSYIEAFQVPPEKMATSVLQMLLKNKNPEYQVINLGASAHDPYDLFFRLTYFEKIYRPTKIVLILEEFFGEWLQRHHHPLNFNNSREWGKEYVNKNPIKDHLKKIIEKSSFLSLVKATYKEGFIKENNNDFIKIKNVKNKRSDPDIPEELKACLIEYKKKYDNEFYLLSIIGNITQNKLLEKYCRNNSIGFFFSNVNISKNKINQKGHLNIEGNKELGRFIYENI